MATAGLEGAGPQAEVNLAYFRVILIQVWLLGSGLEGAGPISGRGGLDTGRCGCWDQELTYPSSCT